MNILHVQMLIHFNHMMHRKNIIYSSPTLLRVTSYFPLMNSRLHLHVKTTPSSLLTVSVFCASIHIGFCSFFPNWNELPNTTTDLALVSTDRLIIAKWITQSLHHWPSASYNFLKCFFFIFWPYLTVDSWQQPKNFGMYMYMLLYKFI